MSAGAPNDGREARLALDLDDQHGHAGPSSSHGDSVAVTVVLPTPPLPATITTRDWEQNRRSSIGAER